MSRPLLDLSVSLSFSSSPVPPYWVLEELFSVTNTLGSLGPRLLGFRRFAKFFLRNLDCLQQLVLRLSTFSLRVFLTLYRVPQFSFLVTAFLSSPVHPLKSWGCLLRTLSSVSALVPGARSLPTLSSAAAVCGGLSPFWPRAGLLWCQLPVGTSVVV